MLIKTSISILGAMILFNQSTHTHVYCVYCDEIRFDNNIDDCQYTSSYVLLLNNG